ncbi:MAG: hypothetical protein QOF75_2890 [Gaiellaceae bacterium]|jgi:uncharacterized protein (DUF58 family)|nr:hypothetical protein [Gaiellaceae bacterium]
MSTGGRRTFPLVPRRRLTGPPFGDLPSRRRGRGSDIIGARPYQGGDPIASIDWFASARASSATGGDEFVVRDHAADEAARVVIVVDRRPAMGLYPPTLPWLSKRDALREAVAAIAGSAAAARADIAALDFAEGEPYWLPPGRNDRQWELVERANGATPFLAPEDTLERALAFLVEHRTSVPPATFVFVLSDFLAPPAPSVWQDAAARGWDAVPVVIQDPVWERSFPDVGGVAVPVADPRTGHVVLVRLSGQQVRRRREQHQRRHDALLAQLASFGVEPVEVTESDPAAVDDAFIAWAEERRLRRWAR